MKTKIIWVLNLTAGLSSCGVGSKCSVESPVNDVIHCHFVILQFGLKHMDKNASFLYVVIIGTPYMQSVKSKLIAECLHFFPVGKDQFHVPVNIKLATMISQGEGTLRGKLSKVTPCTNTMYT